MVLRIVPHRVFSHLPRDLEHFADKYSIPWNLPTNFHPDLIATIQQKCLLLILRTALSSYPICFWSVWCRHTMISWKIFTNFAEFQGIVSVNDFRCPIWLQKLLQPPLCFLRSLCFARIRLNPLGGQVLHHDCISMIVSRFTTFTENFVICCNQIKIFCTKYGSRNASCARRSWNFGPLTDLVIVVFREVRKGSTAQAGPSLRKRTL